MLNDERQYVPLKVINQLKEFSIIVLKVLASSIRQTKEKACRLERIK